jgi:Dolichyl-phosphate-mannose-protein mannosyltransferase
VALYLSHLPLLRLPYYWDEAGYYIPAAYDLFRTGALIPTTTLSNAHPPLPPLYLAAWWHFAGFAPFTTRLAMLMVATLALLGVYRLTQRVTGQTSIAIATALLTALYPVWFAQSTLAHADLSAAAATLWGLALFVPGGRAARILPAAWCLALAALCKETAVCSVLALAGWETWRALRMPADRRLYLRNTGALLLSLVPLGGWYLYHWRRTGFVFGNPEYLRYNAGATLIPLRIVLALLHRCLHLTAHMNLFVPVLCACASLLLVPRRLADGSIRPALAPAFLAPLLCVFLANLLCFSVLGGALLTRYLLPMYPLVLLLCVAAFWRRVPAWGTMVALAAVAFLLGLFINPPYRFAPEDNLSYRDTILLHRQAVHQVAARYPGAVVLTAWPVSDELTKPELGYLRRPMRVLAVDDFSSTQIQLAAALPEFSAAIVFSTKYDPPHLPLSLGPRNQALDRRFFDFHQDLSAQAIAQVLGGRVVWQGERQGQWAAVLHFERPQQALLH